jgi:DnaJ-class molecular chaperone
VNGLSSFETCDRCGGSGFKHIYRQFYTFPCKACGGDGQRLKTRVRVWRLLRHGLKVTGEGEY